jgi:serine/threonine protein kinase
MDKTQADPRIGAVLGGRYRITTLLGEGGMGLVYRGERLQLGRPVAIKFLHGPYARSPKFVARFEREARAMSKLAHPHCVSVIDFGVQDAPYIVMDFVTGQTLRELLDEGRPIPSARALSIVRQVLFGLAHAHAEGVVHRDIKPGNIMLGEMTGMGDHVRIFDFGLAKLHDSELVDGDMSAAHVVGTPAYMAPEQARADKIDARVDLYATGVLLFELLTGEKPFQGDDAYSVLVMQRDKPPPLLRSVRPQFSHELEAVVSRALEKDVDKRFQNAAEFVAALDAVPEATGRPSSSEKDLNSAQLALAKTEHQLRSPVVDSGSIDGLRSQPELARKPELPKKASEGSLAGTPSRAAPTPKRGGFWLWTLLLLGAIGVLGIVLLGSPVPRQEAGSAEPKQPTPAPQLGAAPEAPAPTPRAAVEVPPAEPAPVEAPAPQAAVDAAATSVLLQPGNAEPTAAEPTAAEPAASAESDAGAAPEEELSEAALAAADEALNETSEPEVHLPEAATASVASVTSIAGVQQLIRQGKLDEAIGAVQRLRKKTPKNAELPYLLADLYFDRGWWSDGLAKYREAISMNRNYRMRVSVQRNAIRALGDDRTYPRARLLLAKDVGRVAVGRLRKAAKSDPSKTVRKRASAVLARM